MKFTIQFKKECGHGCLLAIWGLVGLPPGLVPLELPRRLYRQAMLGYRPLIVAKFNFPGSPVPQVRLLIRILRGTRPLRRRNGCVQVLHTVSCSAVANMGPADGIGVAIGSVRRVDAWTSVPTSRDRCAR